MSADQRGFTLMEMVVAIVIISVGLAGLLLAFSTAVRSSADPLVQKQMIAIAEEMLEEVLLKPHAVAGVAPANALVNCGAAGASRVAFDDVRDYHQYRTQGVCDIDGVAVTGLEAYRVTVSVSAATWEGVDDTLQVRVDVTRGTDTFTLIGRRTPYAT